MVEEFVGLVEDPKFDKAKYLDLTDDEIEDSTRNLVSSQTFIFNYKDFSAF